MYPTPFQNTLSNLSRLRQSISRRGLRRTASAGLNRLSEWLEAPLNRQMSSALTKPLPPQAIEAGSQAPTLISPAYEAFQQMPAKVIGRYINLKGCRILEIGGAQACISAKAFLDAGAAQVLVTGLDHIEQEGSTDDQRLIILRADGLDLRQHLEPNSCDVVFGLSIIEHIPEPQRFLQQVGGVLKPGGLALFEGYPLWSSAVGHHLWVASWGGVYAHRCRNNYFFTPLTGVSSSNPVPDWGHLLMNEAEMRQSLLEQSLPVDDISCILDWIYHSPEINRLDSRTILSAYNTSGLTILEANTRRQDVPADILVQLREKHGQGIDYGLSGLEMVLTRSE